MNDHWAKWLCDFTSCHGSVLCVEWLSVINDSEVMRAENWLEITDKNYYTVIIASQTASHKSWRGPSKTVRSRKRGRETVLDRMHRICVAIWETGEWPEEWTFSTFIPLPKKGDFKQCANYRTTALVSHASMILLQIILERIQVKTETETADKHAGFRQGRGTRDQISQYKCTRHASTSNHCIYVLCRLQEGIRLGSPMISCGWLWWTRDILCTWLTCWPNCTGNSTLRSK